MRISASLAFTAAVAALWLPSSVARLVGMPTVPFTATGGSYSLKHINAIIVDARYENTVDEDGVTLIPPTLLSFAKTFSGDLLSSLDLRVPVVVGLKPEPHSIFLTIGTATDYLDAAGRTTSEGYSLDVTKSGVVVTGASPLGAWWGTRTILQQAILGQSSLSIGHGTDSPGWGVRGFMLDAGRHYYPPEFIIEVCSYLSFFKQNTVHMHMSDNLYNNVEQYSYERSMELYSAFRPNSPDPAVAGLSNRPNESYYQHDLENMQQQCASRGVTIIPELEAPGHALVIVQWKPDLGLEDLSMLNISHPDTIPTMEKIWATFLPWFHTKVVHIGADEYQSDLAEDYTYFVNSMQTFVNKVSGKDIRIWGTFIPKNASYAANLSHSVTVQHWEQFEPNPLFEFVDQGYDVLNSDDLFYVVGKWSGSYNQEFNLSAVWVGNSGSPYAPYVFDSGNKTNCAPANSPRVLGQAAAIWNDYGPNATSVIEAYYSLRDALPPLGDKQWGGTLTRDEYDAIFEKLVPFIPGQNLDRRIASKTSTILSYDFSEPSWFSPSSWFGGGGGSNIPDKSGNGYHGTSHGCVIAHGAATFAHGCTISTPLGSKGRNYTLSFSVKPTSSTPGPLFTGPESALLAGNGTSSKVMLITGGNAYPLNYTLPVNEWSDVSLVGRGNATYLEVGGKTLEFTTTIGVNGEFFVYDLPMSILAPLSTIGGEGFEGLISSVVLKDGA